ncbi:MAG: hypothetical protein KJ767_03395 [Nanoarchaeota archaeon]|nr:hypothetical protein [Nanoarchaeota archaeon]
MRTLIIILIILIVIGGFVIIKTMNLNLENEEHKKTLASELLGWFGKLGSNLKSHIGLAISQDWTPDLNTTVNETE